MKFETIYNSNMPIDCHILKGRLDSEGFQSFIFDENIVWVHPFKSVAIGGVKLKVPFYQAEKAKELLDIINQGCLVDENGEYPITEILTTEFNRQNEILRIKKEIRNNPELIHNLDDIDTGIISKHEFENLIESEIIHNKLSQITFEFSIKEFITELLNYNGNISNYLRVRPTNYHLDKELVENFNEEIDEKPIIICPNCKSDNVYYGYAIDFHWDWLYLILSLVLISAFPLFRKKHHCFDCGNNFKIKNGSS